MVDVAAPRADAPAPTILAEISSHLAAGQDLRELLDRFLAPILQIAGARAGAVRMLGADGERLEMVATLGVPESVVECERTVDHLCGFCGRSTNEHRIAWADNLQECALRTGDSFFTDACRRGLAVPLECKGRLLGIYNLFFEDGEAPSPAVMMLLRTVGEMLGLALENHRLEAENLRATVTRERQMMAAEIHDSVAQNLTFVKMRLPLLRDAVEAGNKELALAYLDDVRETIGKAHSCLREIVTHFRTRVDPRGLARALLLLAAHFRARTRIALQMKAPMAELPLGEHARADLYHIVQETLANIERHSRARHAWISLENGAGRVQLRVEDDGVGPGQDSSGEAAHWGLEIMRERAQRLGGELQVEAREGGGTVVRCTFPLPAIAAP